jgi:hypothetical protein
MTDDEAKRLQGENAYLKDRCAQLEASVMDLHAKLCRLQANGNSVPKGRTTGWLHNPLSSGQ